MPNPISNKNLQIQIDELRRQVLRLDIESAGNVVKTNKHIEQVSIDLTQSIDLVVAVVQMSVKAMALILDKLEMRNEAKNLRDKLSVWEVN